MALLIQTLMKNYIESSRYLYRYQDNNSFRAELLKYFFHNTFNAVRISFANSFFEISQNLDINYDVVLDCAIGRIHITKEYLRVNDDLRVCGPCLPKILKL